MNTRLVDFHCHLDLYPDPVLAIADADAAGVYTLTVTTTPRAWPHNLALTKHTRRVRAALGLHPQLVSDHAGEITIWENYLSETRYVGEVGLDGGPEYFGSLPLQTQIFERILKRCAKAGNKILTIHSVRTAKLTLDMIEEHLPAEVGRVVLHWFTGSRSEARRAVDLGCYFSINAEMLRRETGRELVSALPSERLLTETDGPFTQITGRPTSPSDVTTTVKDLAIVRSLEPEQMASAISENLKRLLGDTEGR
jgi:TatD DNase family protein